MAEFLVRIAVTLPPDLDEAERARLLDAEAARGRELIAAGHLRHIWRVPGQHANVSVYATADATELHDLLSSLPLYRWMSVEAEALAEHPLAGSRR